MADCKLTLLDGTHYDLNALASSSNDYTTLVNGTSINLNPCRSVIHELWKVDVPDPGAVSGYIATLDGDFSLGGLQADGAGLSWNDATGDVVMLMGGGSICSSGERASAAIRFICSPSTFSAGSPRFIASLPFLPTLSVGSSDPASTSDLPCAYFFEWSTHLACPTDEKGVLGGHWSHYIWLMVIFIMIALGSLFAGSLIYKRFVLHERGRELLPNFPSVSLPSLDFLRERSSFSFSSLFGRGSGQSWGSWRPGASRSFGGYRNMRQNVDGVYSTEEEEEGLAGGRFSLDDEDDEEDARALSGDPSVWRGVGGGPRSAATVPTRGVDAPPVDAELRGGTVPDWGGFVSGVQSDGGAKGPSTGGLVNL